jgi:hypothetical protein
MTARWIKLVVAVAVTAVSSLVIGPGASAAPQGDTATDLSAWEPQLIYQGLAPLPPGATSVTRDGCTAPSSHIHRYVAAYTSQVLDLGDGYSSANGGTNCAWVQKVGGTQGERSLLGIRVSRCATVPVGGDCESAGDWDTDSDRYYQYAGAVSVGRTDGRCVLIETKYFVDFWSNQLAHRCG